MKIEKSPPKPRITAWSYSRFSVYEPSVGGCPAKAHYKFNLKLPDPMGPAVERGGEIHKHAETYLRTGGTVPPTLKLIKKDIQIMRKAKATPELEWAVTNSWTQTGWWERDVWARAKLDVLIEAEEHVEITDFKTGQYKPEDPGYGMQLELYAVFGFAVKAPAKIKTRLLFTDAGKSVENEFRQQDYPGLKKLWEKRVKPMMTDTVFAPNPGNACRWCPYSKSKGGPCQY